MDYVKCARKAEERHFRKERLTRIKPFKKPDIWRAYYIDSPTFNFGRYPRAYSYCESEAQCSPSDSILMIQNSPFFIRKWEHSGNIRQGKEKWFKPL